MLVKIEEINEQGLKRTEDIQVAVLSAALEASEGFTVISTSPLAASFKKVSGRVFVQGHFSPVLSCPCRRCTVPVEVPLTVDFSLRMIPEPVALRHAPASDAAQPGPPKFRKLKKEDDGQSEFASSFELDEIDAEPFDGKTIDLDPVVREQVLLALPVTVLCKDDCKGLCPKCGEDLNEQDCGHSKLKEVDARLVKLQGIKLKN
jgi:uncharacterized protein